MAVLSLCVSLIQEQISKKAARVLNKNEEKVEMDTYVIVPRRANICQEEPQTFVPIVYGDELPDPVLDAVDEEDEDALEEQEQVRQEDGQDEDAATISEELEDQVDESSSPMEEGQEDQQTSPAASRPVSGKSEGSGSLPGETGSIPGEAEETPPDDGGQE